VLGVNGFDNVLQFAFVVLFSDETQHFAGSLIRCFLTSQRGLRGMVNSSVRNRTAGKVATPNFQRHSSSIRKCGRLQRNSKGKQAEFLYHVELENSDQASAPACRSNLAMYMGPRTDELQCQVANEAEDTGRANSMRGTAQGGNHVQDGHDAQAVAASELVSGDTANMDLGLCRPARRRPSRLD